MIPWMCRVSQLTDENGQHFADNRRVLLQEKFLYWFKSANVQIHNMSALTQAMA